MDYVISDLHFTDAGIIKFERTEFKTIEEHDAHLIKAWNSVVVNNDDTVYFLGDLCDNRYKRDTVPAIAELVHKLHGHKIIILGNHDRFKEEDYITIGFEKVIRGPYFYNPSIIMSHEPCREALNNPYVYNIHGHLHNADLVLPNYICVSAKKVNYKPMKLKKIVAEIKGKTKRRRENMMEEWYADYYDFAKYKLYYDEKGRVDVAKTREKAEPKN